MAIALKTSLLLILALGCMATPLEDMKELETSRSSILTFLNDYSLTNDEAVKLVNERILSILDIQPSLENEGFWLGLLTSEVEIPLTKITEIDIQKILEEELNEESEKLELELIALQESTEFLEIEEEEKQDNMRDTLVSSGFDLIATQLAIKMQALLKSEVIVQFTNQYISKTYNELTFLKVVANKLVSQVVDKMNYFNQEKNIGFEEEASTNIQNIIIDRLTAFNNNQFADIYILMDLCKQGTTYMRVEVQYAFSAIQCWDHISAESRVGRMGLLTEFLMVLSKKNEEPQALSDLSNRLFNYKYHIYQGTNYENKEFAPIYLAVYSRFLILYESLISSETSYVLAKKVLTIGMDIAQTHLHDFALTQKRLVGLPIISEGVNTRNNAELLRVIDFINTLDFHEVDHQWWSSILSKMEMLLNVESGILKLNSYSTILIGSSMELTYEANFEFYQEMYRILLDFTEINGSQLSIMNWNIYFDQYINKLYETDLMVQKYYLAMKVKNVYIYQGVEPFEISFVDFVSSQEEAIAMKNSLENTGFKIVRVILWNVYGKLTSDRKKPSLMNGIFLTSMNNKIVSSVHFDRVKFSYSENVEKVEEFSQKDISNIKIKVRDELFINKLSSPKKSPIKKESRFNKIVVDINEDDSELLVNELNVLKKEESPKLIRIENDLVNEEEQKIIESKMSPIKLNKYESQKKDSEIQTEEKVDTEFNGDFRRMDSWSDYIPEDNEDLEDPALLIQPLLKRSDSKSVYPRYNEDEAEPKSAFYYSEIKDSIKPDDSDSKDIEVYLAPIVESIKEDKEKAEQIERQIEEILNGNEVQDNIDLVKQESTGNEVVVQQLNGLLTPQERKLLEQENLLEILETMTEIEDEEGNKTQFAYVKVVPNGSDCYKKIFKD